MSFYAEKTSDSNITKRLAYRWIQCVRDKACFELNGEHWCCHCMTKRNENGDSRLDFLAKDLRDIVDRHTQFATGKLVSYLPLDTIENIIGLSLDTYTSAIERNGGR